MPLPWRLSQAGCWEALWGSGLTAGICMKPELLRSQERGLPDCVKNRPAGWGWFEAPGLILGFLLDGGHHRAAPGASLGFFVFCLRQGLM